MGWVGASGEIGGGEVGSGVIASRALSSDFIHERAE